MLLSKVLLPLLLVITTTESLLHTDVLRNVIISTHAYDASCAAVRVCLLPL